MGSLSFCSVVPNFCNLAAKFNPMELEEIADYSWKMILENGPRIVLAIITLWIGLRLIRLAVKMLTGYLEKKENDPALIMFLAKVMAIFLKVMLVISVVSMIGVDTTSFIAALGAAGLAVGLALQGSLANFAGGVLILLFKPFRVSEFIETQGHLGVVENIDILHTTLRTPDNKTVIVPNGQLANQPITNFTRKETRRVEWQIGISYGSDMKKARSIVLRILSEEDRILKEPEPLMVLSNLGDSSLNFLARAWVNTPDFWVVYWDNLEKIKEAFDKEGIVIPFPQRDVHLIPQKEK